MEFMKKTKIITSLGPSSYNGDTFEQMVLNGANIARVNFSHATPEEKQMDIDTVKEVRKRTGLTIGLLYDTKGPEFRNGVFEKDEITLVEGNTIRIVKDDVVGNEERFTVNHPEAIDSIEVGNSVLLENGLMRLDVISKEKDGITCKIINGGILGNKKSMAVPGVRLNMPFISDQDREDIIFACEHEGDYLALSFVSCAEDVLEARKIIDEHKSSMKIIAKIESVAGFNNLASILEVADGIMVARGDLGNECPLDMLPIYQKEMIRMAREVGKPVVVATEMLESMKKSMRPTRAEVSDVSNAVFDGTDAVMLSGETTMGKFPAETVKYMAEICATAEKYYDKTFNYNNEGQIGSIAKGVVETAKALDAKAIVVASITGESAKHISNLKPNCPVVAVCVSQEVANKLTVCYGIKPVVGKFIDDMDQMTKQNVDLAKKALGLKKGDKVIITSGLSNKKQGTITNFMKVEEI
ncbi:MAG: pyruvate kinase [Bacilli bacterium]|nr:pyruvate kinase [Bacilli bacterium]